MTEDQSKSAEQAAGDATAPPGHEEVNWGEDWESAFLAEDDAFFFEGKEEDFFLDEKETTAGPKAAKPEGPPAGESPAETQELPPSGAGALAVLILTCKAAAQKQLARLQAFPLFIRIPIYALPLLVAGGAIFLLFSGPPVPSGKYPGGTASQTGSSGESASGSQGKLAAGNDLPEASQLHPGKVRKKWPFPAFFIPVAGQTPGQPVTFVLTEVTLYVSLDEQEEPPAEKKIFVRDIIYQFFQNRPIEDLRRFSLARGEMGRELRAWLLKQWPDAPVESISFNQYRLS